ITRHHTASPGSSIRTLIATIGFDSRRTRWRHARILWNHQAYANLRISPRLALRPRPTAFLDAPIDRHSSPFRGDGLFDEDRDRRAGPGPLGHSTYDRVIRKATSKGIFRCVMNFVLWAVPGLHARRVFLATHRIVCRKSAKRGDEFTTRSYII